MQIACLMLAVTTGQAKVVELDYATAAIPSRVAASRTVSLSSAAAAISPADGLLRSYSVETRATLAAATAALNVGDSVCLRLFSDVSLTAAVTRVSFDAFGPVYYGAIDNTECVTFLPTSEGLQIDAQSIAARRVYKVLPSATATTIAEYEPPTHSVCGVTDALVPSRTARAAATVSSTETQTSTLIDVLVVYDSGALAWVNQNTTSGATNFARTAVAKANTALANTGLDSLFNFRLVGITNVTASYTNVETCLTDIRPTDKWTSPAAAFANIETLRTEVGADTVVVLIDTGSTSGTTGIGYSLQSTPIANFADYAYACCAIRSVSTSHTMTHEIGHNLGAGHSDKQGAGNCGPQWGTVKPYSCGYHFSDSNGNRCHTVMAYNYDGTGLSYPTEVPYFSTPDYEWNGVPAGTASNDNTRVLRETYAAAAQWRSQVVPITYGVTFSPEDGSVFSDSLTVTLTPGTTNLSIYYTLDGSTPTTSSTLYTGPITFTAATTINAITYDGANASPIFTATYTKSTLGPGIWTADIDEVKKLAALDGGLIVCLASDMTNANDGVCQSLQPIVDSAAFLDWAKANDVYLVAADSTLYTNATSALQFFQDQYSSLIETNSYYWGTLTVATGDATALGFLYANAGQSINNAQTTYYEGTADSLVACICAIANITPLGPPGISPADALVDSYPVTVTLSNTNRSGTLHYTLDGSVPTKTSATYSTTLSITSSAQIVKAAVWPASGPSSPVTVRQYQIINNLLGTTGITWSRGGDTRWFAPENTTATLQNGDFTTNGTSWLQGVFTGKGTLVYTLASSSWVRGGGNMSTVTVDGNQFYRWSHDGTNATATVVLTNTFTTTGTHTVRWAYTVGYYQWYYGSANSYARLSDLIWTPEATATTNSVPVPYTWLNTYYPSLATAAAYNTAALEDSDGDGFAAWEEYLAGTDPTNAASYFYATIRLQSGLPIIEWNVTNRNLATYTVLGATNLTGTFSAPTNSAHRFFRVRATPIE